MQILFSILFLCFVFPFLSYLFVTAGKMNHIRHFAVLSKNNDSYPHSPLLSTKTHDWLQEKLLCTVFSLRLITLIPREHNTLMKS